MSNELPMIESEPIRTTSCCRLSPFSIGICVGLTIACVGALGFLAGRTTSGAKTSTSLVNGIPNDRLPPELLRATATHGGNNLAVCTAWIDDDSEGFFALDFNTGDLKCWVYYPRQQSFGGLFMTNVQPFLGMSKNPEYLLVSGGAVPSSTGGNIRPASSLVYVVDTKSGLFASYTIPWNRTAESSSAVQGGQIVFMGGGIVREPQSGIKKPAAPPPAAGGRNPVGAAPPANPNAPGNPNAGDPAGKAPAGGVPPPLANPPGGNPPAGGNPGNKKK